MSRLVLAFRERCGRLFHSLPPGKFCDEPTCQGWLHHIDRGRKGVRS